MDFYLGFYSKHTGLTDNYSYGTDTVILLCSLLIQWPLQLAIGFIYLFYYLFILLHSILDKHIIMQLTLSRCTVYLCLLAMTIKIFYEREVLILNSTELMGTLWHRTQN